MNYLAHAYFSFMDEEIMIGNLISDFVKGKKKFDYPLPIQKGIQLHREIDAFTDAHAITKEARQYFKPAVGLYSGAFVDVVYDHFLASGDHWNELPLDAFAPMVYDHLSNNYQLLPAPLQQMLPYMKNQNWLYNYRFQHGIEKSFQGIARRASFLTHSDAAFRAFCTHYEALSFISQSFIADVKKFASERFQLLMMA